MADTSILMTASPSSLFTAPSVQLPVDATGSSEFLAMRRPRLRLSVVDASTGAAVETPATIRALESDLNRLLSLPTNWDGNGARQVTNDAIEALVWVFGLVMDATSIAPQVFPLRDGGVQAEWHATTDHIEVAVPGDGASIAVVAQSADVEHELETHPADPHRYEVMTPIRTQLNRVSARLQRQLTAIAQ